MTSLSDPGQKAIDNLSSKLKNPADDITPQLLKFELENAEESTALCQHGLLFSSEDQVHRIIKIRSNDSELSQQLKQAVSEQAEIWLNEYEGWQKQMTYRQRRKKLEDVIRLLLHVNDKDKLETERLILLARAYLYRSMLFRPKGYTTPARKIEGLLEAKDLLTEKIPKKDINHPEVLKIWAQTCLELNNEKHFEFNDEDKKRLKQAAEAVKKSDVSGMGDLMVLVRYAEITKDVSCLEPVSKEEKDWGQPFDLMLFKARASFLKNENPQEVKDFTAQAIENAPEAFSSPFWDELVLFLNRIRTEEKDNKWNIWKELSISACELCREREKEITDNIVLHWHWSQRKALYDLAFLAAESSELKVDIADSLKSRPALRYNALHGMRNRDIVRQILETEDGARDSRYLKKFSGRSGRAISKKIEKHQGLSWNALPENWTAIHFYLNEIDKKGYAFMIDSKGNWKPTKPFDYHELHQTFQKWQAVYVTDDEIASAENMHNLCLKIGETMSFLFDDILKDKSILFVPYGFLHHLPIHAAIEKNTERVFFKEHASQYLPAWHLTGLSSPQNKNKTTDKWHFIVKTEAKSNYDKTILKLSWDNKDEDSNFDEYLKINPEVLAVLCHGKCDLLNSFRSKLLLEPEKSILSILIDQPRLNGTRVFLGACESDMSPFSENPLDEHISLSSVFLTGGAKEVTGGVYRLQSTKIAKCYHTILEKFKKGGSEQVNLPEELQNWQIKNMQKKPSEKPKIFYQIIPFRIMGFPQALSKNDKETAS